MRVRVKAHYRTVRGSRKRAGRSRTASASAVGAYRRRRRRSGLPKRSARTGRFVRG